MRLVISHEGAQENAHESVYLMHEICPEVPTTIAAKIITKNLFTKIIFRGN